MVFRTMAGASAATDKVWITAAGDVGIGRITGGLYKLDVYRDEASRWVAQFDQDHANGYGVRITGDMTGTEPLLSVESVSTEVFKVQGNGTTTATAFVGPLTGNVTGTAVAVTQAAQSAITSVGTLTSATITGDLIVDTSTLKVDSSNNRVGIGTASPGYPLVVGAGGDNGTFQFSTTGIRIGSGHEGHEMNLVGGIPDGTNMGGQVRLGGASRADGDVNVIQFIQNGTERMRVHNGGYVGIGTASPTYRLQVAHTGNTLQGRFDGGWDDNLNSNSRLIFNDHNFGIGAGQVGDASNQDDLVLWAYSGTNRGISFKATSNGDGTTFQSMTTWMRIVGGNVGIGTTAPAHPLHIGTDNGIVAFGADSDLKISGGANSLIDHDGNGDLWLRTLGENEHIYINSGQGASSPGKILFQRAGTTVMELRVGATTHTGGGDADAEHGGVGFAAAGIYIDRHWVGNPGITICNSNVNSSTILSQGTFRFHGSNHSYASYPAASGSDFGIAVVCDGTFSPTSDERRKTDIEDITGALASVNALRGRTFKFKNSNLETEEPGSIGGKLYGLIAQEALDVVPHAIWDDGEEPLENGWCRSMRMDYGALTAVLVEAIKELTTRLEALEDA
jgi:hypothetical protein